MNTADILRSWTRILSGHRPALSIEITRECPLRCPGCYAYEPGHIDGTRSLRGLSDFKGDELVRRVLDLVDRLKPLHLSIVGGDPLVRYRELERLLPALVARRIHVQVVTSAFRTVPAAWSEMNGVTIVVSIDGLQPEHDERRKPATYDRILKNIAGTRITIHSTITSQMVRRPGYLDEFARFWTSRDEVARIWFSLFTPQRGDFPEERLTAAERAAVVRELQHVARHHAKVAMSPGIASQFLSPPSSPRECIFARTTETVSADLESRITPCQFGGDPDCSQCGCYASMGLAALGSHRLGGVLPVSALFRASASIGDAWNRNVPPLRTAPKPVLVTLEPGSEQ